ncbi:MAG: MGMT family protein [Chitinophagales bacterium]|nr:MGMT family protein [Chitinophagales bacterium]
MKDLSFFEQVYAVVRLIPTGRVTTYGAIAVAVGAKKAARMVGYAMNNSHVVEPQVPAHRVVNRKGLLTGRHHFSPPELMEKLLSEEGIIIRNQQIQNFDKHFWEPIEEIRI